MVEAENGWEQPWRSTFGQGSHNGVGNRDGGWVGKHPRPFRCQSIYIRRKKRRRDVEYEAMRRKDAAKILQRWIRCTRQRRVYRQLLAHVVQIQAAWRGAGTRRHLAMNRAAALLRARMRLRAAIELFCWERDAAIALQARGRGMLARKHFANLQKAARRRQTFGLISCLVALAIVVAIAVGLFFGGASPCQRGNTLSRGDAPLAPGECIESATGSRLFGWIPGVSAKARLSVTGDGRMNAKKPDGAEVVLAGDIPANGRNGDLLCLAERLAFIVSGQNEPNYGARNARGQLVLGKEYHCSVYHTSGPKGVRGRLDAWLTHGGHVGFSSDGDLQVVSSQGSVWWSLAKELAEDDDKKARTGSAEPSRGRK